MSFENRRFRLSADDHCVYGQCAGERVMLAATRGGGIRVRATRNRSFSEKHWSVDPETVMPERCAASDEGAELVTATTCARISWDGQIRFFDASGNLLLEETPAPKPYHVPAREYESAGSSTWRVHVAFDAPPDERVFGMGQHQDGLLNKKGSVVDLLQRNTHVVIPFYFSTAGYGFVWNNPASGRVEFGTNRNRWVADSTHDIDYVLFAASAPSSALGAYCELTGYPSAFPRFASGFWQSRLRYESQDEVLEVVREHKRLGLPLSVIVIDFFHWSRMGDWEFDAKQWPDPRTMVQEIRNAGAEVMVSVWPTVNPDSKNYEEMDERGFLARSLAGHDAVRLFTDTDTTSSKALAYYDPFNPEARDFVWETVRRNYAELGVRVFWLDSCEPEVFPYRPQSFSYALGRGDEVTNAYPVFHERGFYEGMLDAGIERPLNLCRSAWLGSQKYGVAVWSGDVIGDFEALRLQVTAGLSMAMSGIPWWTTDIGGFFVEDPDTDEYRELLIRWFQFGVFSPLCRLHGYRKPVDFKTAGPNEVWSYGRSVYETLRELLLLRERLRSYVEEQMEVASATGAPVMRPMFFEFPDDPSSYEIEDQYMFGPDILVAPVVEYGARAREVYVPTGSVFIDPYGDSRHEGSSAGKRVVVEAPLVRPTVLVREGSTVVSAIRE